MTRKICSTICETAVGVMRCQPCKYPRDAAKNVTKNTVGAKTTTDMYARASRMNCHSISQLAERYVSTENITPVINISAIEIRKTRLAPKMSLSATRSAVIIEIATGTPACDTVIAKKYIGNAIWYKPIPSPPSIRETNIQFSEPITLTTKLAIVRMNVPRKSFSLPVDFVSVIAHCPWLQKIFSKVIIATDYSIFSAQ